MIGDTNLKKFKITESSTLRKSEPLEVLELINTSSKQISLFPKFEEFINSKPKQLFPLILNGLRNSKIIKIEKIKSEEYRLLENSKFWNELALIYLKNKQYEKGSRIFDEMLKIGASDSATLNNYAVAILNRMMASGRIYPELLDKVKEYLIKAFAYDVPKHNKLIEGALAPAFKNLIFIRSIESDLFLQRGELFTSFLLGWISIEMSLIRMWLRYLKDKNFSTSKRESLVKWDISIIIETLFLVGLLSQNMKNDIDCLRTFRNQVVHGVIIQPEKGQVKKCMTLSRDLFLKDT